MVVVLDGVCMNDDEPVVNATVNSFRVLEAVRDLDGAGISEIARHVDRSKGGVYRHVKTLERLGYLTRRGDSYELAIGLWTLAADVPERLLDTDGWRTLDSVAASTDYSVSLVLYEGGRAVYAYQECSPAVERLIGGLGDEVPLHATAAGKAILAYLSADQIDSRIEDRDLPAFNDDTVTDATALRSELDTVRDERIAVERGERHPELHSVAAPILVDPQRPLGAIAVTATTDELGDTDLEREVASFAVNASLAVGKTLS